MRKTLLALVLIAALTGCGLKGNLYLDNTAAQETTAPAPLENTAP